MAILFQLSGVDEVRRFMDGAVAAGKDTRRVRKVIGEEMLHRNHTRLAAGLDVDGKPMPRSRRVQRNGGQTLFDRGALAASVNYALTGEDLDLFSTDKRAGVHYRGDTILPKKGQFLAIPLRARGGLFQLEKAPPALANRTGARPRHYAASATFFKRFGGKLFLVMRHGGTKGKKGDGQGKGRLTLLFLMVRKAKMIERRWMGYSKDDVAWAAEQYASAIFGKGGGAQ